MITKKLLNTLIDIVSFINFSLLIATGLLLKFILPPGNGRLEHLLKPQGRLSHKTIDTWMTLTRHEWGQIHFYISCIFLCLLTTHLILHWPWIKATMFKRLPHEKPQTFRQILTLIIIVACLLFIILPWIIPPQTHPASNFLNNYFPPK